MTPTPAPLPAPTPAPTPTPVPDRVLDCLGRRCPLPIIDAARLMTTLPLGSVLGVLADDPAARTDFPAWCRLRGQEYLGEGADEAGHPSYLLRRLV